MKNFWSMIKSFYVYYSYNGEDVYIANPESKKFFGPVKKIAESVKDPELFENDGHKMKIEGGNIKLEISGKYYTIKNACLDNYLDILSSATIVNGETEKIYFGFNYTDPSKTVIIFDNSELHKRCEKEFIRRTNLSLYKKTTKYIYGHRYDFENGSYVYLGKYVSHKSDQKLSKKYSTSPSTVRHLHAFTTDLAWKNSLFGEYRMIELPKHPEYDIEETIFFTDKKKSLVDCGEVVKDMGDTWKLENIWEDCVEKFYLNNRRPYSFQSEKYYYDDLNKLFYMFDYSSDCSPQVTEKTKELVKEIIRIQLKYILFSSYDLALYSRQYNILDKDDIDKKSYNLINHLVYFYAKDNLNYYELDYFKEKISTLFQIDLIDLAKEEINAFKPYVPTGDFKDFVNNISNYQYRNPEQFDKEINFAYTSKETTSLKSWIKPGDYLETIKDIIRIALESGGENLKDFGTSNIGTQQSPLLLYSFCISWKDILNHFKIKTMEGLPISLKVDLIDNKIYKLFISMREDIKIQDL